jgi:N-acetyl-anhydromuramyl-L-alanine amidase AmpD
MKIIEDHLPPSQYFRQAFRKTNIVLHHTVSSTARSALTWWKSQPARIGTAYVVDKDGTIYEAFSPEHWAHHLGIKGPTNIPLNRRSIGIEIVNEGPLTIKSGNLRWNFSDDKPGTPYAGAYVRTPVWRGFDLWATYTDAQYEAVRDLVAQLCQDFSLPPTCITHRNFDANAPNKATVYAHYHVRTDKSDLSPAFDFSRITSTNSSLIL